MEEVLNSTVRTYVFFNNIRFSEPIIVLGIFGHNFWRISIDYYRKL